MGELRRAALVGTQQRADAAPPAPEPAVEALFGALAGAGRERALLLRAGAGAIYRRAGFAPPRVAELPAPAPPEERPACGPALTALLRAFFDGVNVSVLPEALDLVAEAGLRLPSELLPAALDVADRSLRERLRPTLGARGRWLARLEPAWAWASTAAVDGELPGDADARWEEARHEERVALLAQARRVDVERSRRWLAATWSAEKVDHRAEMLARLEIGLGAEDEPLLTVALADRSAAVRVAAARLLWRVPASALAGRMRERAGSFLAAYRPPRPGVPRGAQAAGRGKPAAGELDVRLPPDSFDPAWGRDGVVEQPPRGHELGRRQWWLAQMIAAVPPSHWEERLAAPPAALVAAAAAHEFGDPVIDGFTAAALSHRASSWCEPLWEFWLARPARGALFAAPLAELLARMPAEAQARRACQLLAGGAVDLGALEALPRPWPVAVADEFLARFPAMWRPAGGPAHPWEGWLGRVALSLPASHLGRTLMVVEPDANDRPGRRLIRAVDEFHAVLAIRRRLHEEIRGEHERRP